VRDSKYLCLFLRLSCLLLGSFQAPASLSKLDSAAVALSFTLTHSLMPLLLCICQALLKLQQIRICCRLGLPQ